MYDAYGRPVRRTGESGGAVVGSGPPIYGGVFAWEQPPELGTPEKRAEAYRKMYESDAYIYEAIRQNSLPLLSHAIWKVSAPFNDEVEGPLEEAIDLCRTNLYGMPTKRYGKKFLQVHSWRQRLREILRMLEYGFSLFHKEWHVVDSKRVYRRLLWLEPSTIMSWDLGADDTIRGVWRRYIGADGKPRQMEYLPADELALYVWDISGTRLEGLPMLRPMFGPWKRKEFLLRCKMIAAQRAGVGMPWAKRDPAEDGDDSDKTTAVIESFLQSSLGTGIEMGYLSSTNPSLEMGYLQQDAAELRKFDQMNEDENYSFSHAGGTKATMLGETNVGARASAETMQGVSYILVEAISMMIAEQETIGIGNLTGVVQDVTDWNWADIDHYPVVTCSNVDPNESERKIKMLNESKKSGLLNYRTQIERYILERANIAVTDEEFEEEMPDPAPALSPGGLPAAGNSPSPARGTAPPADAGGRGRDVAVEGRRASIRASVEDALWVPADTTDLRRYPTSFEEKVLVLADLSAAMDESDQKVETLLRRSWRDMNADFMDRAKAGKVGPGSLHGLRRSLPKAYGKMRQNAVEAFMATARMGRKHGLEELGRQEGLQFASIPPGGRIPDPPSSMPTWATSAMWTEIARDAMVAGEIVLDGLWQRVIGEGYKEMQRLAALGYRGEDLFTKLEAFLMGLSEGPMTAASRQITTQAYNLGRDLAAKESGQAYAMRSEVLDNRTCGPCAKLDGTVYLIGSPEYEMAIPPAGCDGKTNCRGVMIIISNGALGGRR